MAEHQNMFPLKNYNKKKTEEKKQTNPNKIQKTEWQSDNATIPKIFRGYNIVIFNM